MRALVFFVGVVVGAGAVLASKLRFTLVAVPAGTLPPLSVEEFDALHDVDAAEWFRKTFGDDDEQS